MKRCRSKKTHWPTRRAAFAALEHIHAQGPGERLYMPTGVIGCHCGGFVLTSDAGRAFGKGKASRRPTAQQRRR